MAAEPLARKVPRSRASTRLLSTKTITAWLDEDILGRQVLVWLAPRHLVGCMTVTKEFGAATRAAAVALSQRHALASVGPTHVLLLRLQGRRPSVEEFVQEASRKHIHPRKEYRTHSCKGWCIGRHERCPKCMNVECVCAATPLELPWEWNTLAPGYRSLFNEDFQTRITMHTLTKPCSEAVQIDMPINLDPTLSQEDQLLFHCDLLWFPDPDTAISTLTKYRLKWDADLARQPTEAARVMFVLKTWSPLWRLLCGGDISPHGIEPRVEWLRVQLSLGIIHDDCHPAWSAQTNGWWSLCTVLAQWTPGETALWVKRIFDGEIIAVPISRVRNINFSWNMNFVFDVLPDLRRKFMVRLLERYKRKSVG